MTKILITGEGSYVGMSFENYIQQFDNFQVDTIDMIDGSWRDKSFGGYDVVFHVAGIAHSDFGKISEERKSLYYTVNTDLAIDTASKAKADGVKQFVFMSSASVYGESAPIGKKKVITKDTPLSALNVYGDSKIKAEEGLKLLRDDKFKVVILRPPMIYGKGCKGNYITLSKFAKKLPVFPNVNNERSMLYIGNLVEFVRLMIENKEDGVFLPQNAEYSNTSNVVKIISNANGKKIHLVKGFSWALKISSHITGLVNKAFGNLSYDMELSKYKDNYQVFTLEESIRLTEGVSDSKKPRALMLTSVASMIDQFNMHNIQLLLDNGYDVDVVCNCKTGNNISDARVEQLIADLSQKGVKVYDVSIPRKITDILGILKSIRKIKALAKINNYLLMHCHSPIGSVVARLAFKRSRKCGTKVVYTAHGFHFYKGAPKLNWLLFYPIEKHFSKHTDVLITINKEDYEFAQTHLKANQVVYIPGIGIDTVLFDEAVDCEKKKREFGLLDTDLIVFSVGELNQNKNHETIIKAIAKADNPNIHYFIAGKGEKADDLSQLAKTLNVNLHLLGYRTDIPQLYKMADIYVFPSYREGLSVSLMEAMASGLACVVSKIRGNVDLIDEDKGGYLCLPNDENMFFEKINAVLCDIEKNRQFGQYNKDKIQAFDKDIVLKKIAQLYFDN